MGTWKQWVGLEAESFNKKDNFAVAKTKRGERPFVVREQKGGLWKNCSMTLGEQKRQILQKGDKLQLWKRCERKYF